MNDGFRVGSPDIVFEEFSGEMVVLNLASGQYFGLNPAGAACWQFIVSGASISRSAASPEDAAKLAVFAARLESFGLIAPLEAGSSVAAPASGFSFEGTPQVDVFDDLADLIVADPIHDVDAGAGWPAKPAA